MTNRRKFIKQTSIGIASILALRSEIFAVNPKMNFIIPAYFNALDHSDLWTQMIDGCQNGDIIIINPHDGPFVDFGDNPDGNIKSYKEQINKAVAKGIVIAGYVHTNWLWESAEYRRKREVCGIWEEIKNYQKIYGVKNIFFDELELEKNESPENPTITWSYYKELCDYVHKEKGITILNPGIVLKYAKFAEITDKIVVFESDFGSYDSAKDNSWSWTLKVSRQKIAHLVHSTNEGQLKMALEKARKRNVGYLYVTDFNKENNIWGGLPSYWKNEITEIRK
jgi:hypothetical protein